MSEQPRPPREIDRADVLGELEHRWAQTAGHSGGEQAGVAWVLNELTELDILRYREPADDPDRDVTGVVRRGPGGQIVAKGSRVGFPWANLSAPKGDDTYSNSAVIGWPVIGTVPGTQAAESSDLVRFEAPPDWRIQLAGADPAYLMESWQVSGPAEADTPRQPVPLSKIFPDIPLCKAMEGATGITCHMKKGHAADIDHEGEHIPNGDRDSVGYRMTVRWPWNEYDRDKPGVV